MFTFESTSNPQPVFILSNTNNWIQYTGQEIDSPITAIKTNNQYYAVVDPYSSQQLEDLLSASSYPVYFLIDSTANGFNPRLNLLNSLDVSLLKKWNVEGEISVNRSFENHPSASFRFKTYQNQEEIIRAELAKGKTVSLFGLKFIVSSLRIIRESIKEKRIFNLSVEVSLEGIHSSYGNPSKSPLDTLYRLRNWAVKNGNVQLIDLKEVGQSLGVLIIGGDIKKVVEANTPSTATSTLRQDIESLAESHLLFPYYSNPNALELREWKKQNKHYLEKESILNKDIGLSLPGQNSFVDNVQLVQEYKNTELLVDDVPEVFKKQKITRWEFNRCIDLNDLKSPEKITHYSFYIKKEFDPDTFLDAGNAFDSGGYTKEAIKYTQLNGADLEEERWVYGLVFTSLDFYTVTENRNVDIKNEVVATNGNNALAQRTSTLSNEWKTQYTGLKLLSEKSYWKLVEYTKTEYLYEDKTGYLIGTKTTGTKIARFKSESGQQEAITTLLEAMKLEFEVDKLLAQREDYNLNLDATIDYENIQGEELETLEKTTRKTQNDTFDKSIATVTKEAQIKRKEVELYKFTETLPIEKETSYKLEPLGKHYKDVIRPDKCDPDWIEPKYVSISNTRETQYLITENPENITPAEVTKPEATPEIDTEVFESEVSSEIKFPVFTGKEFEEGSIITIVSTKSPEKFKTLNYRRNSEGEGKENKLEIISSIDSLGRPSTQTRRESSFYSGTINDLILPCGDDKQVLDIDNNEPSAKKRYFLNADEDLCIPKNQVRFEQLYDPECAAKVAKYNLEKANLSAETTKIKTFYDPTIQEGSIIYLEGKEYLINSIDFAVSFLFRKDTLELKVEDYELSLGRLLDIPVTLTTVSNQGLNQESLPIQSSSINLSAAESEEIAKILESFYSQSLSLEEYLLSGTGLTKDQENYLKEFFGLI